MTDFDNAFKKVAEVIQTAARKSGEIIENTKISYSISAEKDKITKLQTKIGAKFNKIFNEGGAVPDFILAELREIAAVEDNIRTLEKNYAEAKNFKFCQECGSKLDIADVYCAKCGTKQRNNKAEDEGCRCAKDDDVCCDEDGADDDGEADKEHNEQTKSEQTKSEQTKSEQTKSEQTKSEQTNGEQTDGQEVNENVQ